MNCESLYEEFKWKKYQQQSAQQRQKQRIKQLAEAPKINPKSNFILSSKLFEDLQKFNDRELVSLETSIPILHSAHILQIISSLQEAREKLKNHDHEHERLKWEGKFLIELWRLLDQEEIQVRQLKEIIYLLHEKRGRELKEILMEMFNDKDGVEELLEAWKQLTYDRQYYKHNCMVQNKENDIELSQIKENQRKQKLFSPMNLTDTLLERGIGYSYVMSADKEKQLVSRLYRNDIYKNREQLKKQRQQQKFKQQMEHCTFKPKTNQRQRSTSQTKKSKIKGYDKAIDRLRTGTQKHNQKRNLRQYKPTGQNYEKLKQKPINPPKFLNRKKQQNKVLFMISFDLGRHKTNVKIRQGQNEETVAERLCKIYSLKQDYYDQICKIIRTELEQYYQQQYEKEVYRDYGQ